MIRRRVPLIASVAVLILASSLGVAGATSPRPDGVSAGYGTVASTGDGVDLQLGDWSTWQHDIRGSRFNAAENTITPSNVQQLKLKWAYAYPFLNNDARIGSQPAIVNGVLYVGSPDAKLLALDAKTGATKWTFDTVPVAGPWSTTDFSTLNIIRDGPAVADGKVFFADSRGWLYALSQDTGTLIWATKLDPHPKTWITSSPLAYQGHILIGISSQESGITDPNYPCCTHVGSVVSVDENTGGIVWRHYTLPKPQLVGTWASGAEKWEPAGGMVWGSGVVDPPSNTVFFGTGNLHSGGEANIGQDSLIALDVATGALKWTHQFTPRDTLNEWCVQANLDPAEYCPWKAAGYGLNYDVGATSNVYHVSGRTIVAVGQKGGMFHALDAATGQTVWETRLAQENLSSRDPGSVGTPWGSTYDGHSIYAATWRGNPGTLYALDPATGRIKWATPVPEDACTTGGAAAYPTLCERSFDPAATSTPGLVYEGAGDGKMRIFSAETGQVLWTFDAVRDFDGVNGLPGRGKAISSNGGAVVANGMLYVQAGYYPMYPGNGKGTVLLAFGL
jgi:polyvinyl alcohol dehydrogenase (cytochrome)